MRSNIGFPYMRQSRSRYFSHSFNDNTMSLEIQDFKRRLYTSHSLWYNYSYEILFVDIISTLPTSNLWIYKHQARAFIKVHNLIFLMKKATL